MLGSLFKAVLNDGLSTQECDQILDQVKHVRGVNSANFNKAAKAGAEIWIHTMGTNIEADVRKINGVKAITQLPVA